MRFSTRMRSDNGKRPVVNFPMNEIEQGAALFLGEFVALARRP
jgi:hypothetical protein